MKALSEALPEFREWLESQTNPQKVGSPRRVGFCPIALWLREREGEDDISVEYFHVRRGSHTTKTPRWIRLFISRVDRAVETESAVVPKRTALEVLDKVEKDVRRKR